MNFSDIEKLEGYKTYSDIIMSASEIRNSSDYDDFFLASKEETKEQIENAEHFISAIETYLNCIVESAKS